MRTAFWEISGSIWSGTKKYIRTFSVYNHLNIAVSSWISYCVLKLLTTTPVVHSIRSSLIPSDIIYHELETFNYFFESQYRIQS